MKIETVATDSLLADPANVRLHSDRNLASIAASLRRFGQQKPVVVDAQGVVRAGSGTLAAARMIGLTHLQIVRTQLTGAEATAYAIADNRVGDPDVGSEWDVNKLASTLSALGSQESALAESTGFTADELAAVTGVAGGPLPVKAGGTAFDEHTGDCVPTITCSSCGRKFPK